MWSVNAGRVTPRRTASTPSRSDRPAGDARIRGRRGARRREPSAPARSRRTCCLPRRSPRARDDRGDRRGHRDLPGRSRRAQPPSQRTERPVLCGSRRSPERNQKAPGEFLIRHRGGVRQCEHRCERVDVLLDPRAAPRDTDAHRLAENQRPDLRAGPRGGKDRRERTVRMSDQIAARPQRAQHSPRVGLRVVPIAGPLHEHATVDLRRGLDRPRRSPRPAATVQQHDAHSAGSYRHGERRASEADTSRSTARVRCLASPLVTAAPRRPKCLPSIRSRRGEAAIDEQWHLLAEVRLGRDLHVRAIAPRRSAHAR